MNKPTANTAWATDGSAKKIEPLESQRQSGWVYQDTPSSGVVNNWMNAVHQWLRYFETLGDPRPDIEDLQKRVQWLEDIVHKLLRPPREVDPLIPEIKDPLQNPFPEQPITLKETPHVHDDTQRLTDRTRPPLSMATKNSFPEGDGPIRRLCPTEDE